MWKQMCYRTQHIHSLWLLHYGSVSHTDHYPCKILLCNHVIMNINADCVWTQLWNSSWWPRERLRAGGETSVYHVQTADVWQLASHLVFLLQGIHHTFPWVSLNLYFCLKWVSFTSICLCQKCMRCVQSMGISMYLFFLSLSFFCLTAARRFSRYASADLYWGCEIDPKHTLGVVCVGGKKTRAIKTNMQ